MKYQGSLQAIIESLTEKKTSDRGRLTGNPLIEVPGGLRVLLAIDSKGCVHLLLAPCPSSLGRLTRLKLKALVLERNRWVVSGNPADYFLDIKCTASVKSSIMRPFIGFCEDVLEEIDRGKLKPEDVVYKTWLRWRRFWSSDRQPFSQEWLRGLIGETQFLESLAKRYGEEVIGCWTGPEKQDHDFQFGRTVCEVKTTGKIPATIRINNLNQLDNDLVERLYLACFHLSADVDGQSLVDVIRRIESILGDDSLELFTEKLARTGYQRSRENEYAEFRFDISKPIIFKVDDRFPKITMKSFKNTLDARVVRVLFDVELTGLKSIKPDSINWL